MCGIAGYTGYSDESILNKMIQSIRYRGPDAQGTYIDQEIALGHARLSILDTRPEGHQPMFSSNKQIAISFNGEIYNYLELKEKLKADCEFKTSTDTEVLLYLYLKYGVNMLQKISGMFAFAIYDFSSKELFIARDRMGKKPIYYSALENTFVFASEIKALLKHPDIKNELNIEAVNQYLSFDYVPAPNSILKNVFKLEAAHYMIVKNHKIIKHEAFWQPDFKINTSITFEEAKVRLNELLLEATKKRLMSDVPLGVFLSGGLDSSTIAYYAQQNAGQKIKTFSIGFEDKSYDESDYASMVAKHLGTDHYSEILHPKQSLDLIEKIYPLLDEPFADASLIPTYFLSAFTKQHVTVALGGDGSDELLAGYPTFMTNYFKQPLASLPSDVSKYLLKMAVKVLPASDKNISFDFKVKQYLRGFLSNKESIHQLWLGSFTPDEKKRFFKQDIYENLNDQSGLAITHEHYNNTGKGWSNLNKDIYYYLKTYLTDDILVKIDRAGMYNSLEVRAPFLDLDVVTFINSLPDNYKLRGLEVKYILKKLMEGKLPPLILERPKKGFGIPLSDWIRKDLSKVISDVLLQKDDLFNVSYIETLLKEHASKKFNHRKLIWNLFILKWYLINQKNFD